MKTLINKKGMGLPMVLGITVFIIGLSATLMSYIVFQGRLVEYDIEDSENYFNAVSNVSSALNYMSQNPDMLEDEIATLANYLNVTIEKNENGLYIITSSFDENKEVISYMTGSTLNTDIDEEIFDYNGTEDNFDLSPVVTSEILLSDYMPTYVINTLGLEDTPENMNSYDDVMNYMESLANQDLIANVSSSDLEKMKTALITETTYVSSDIELERNQDLIVSNGSILFIDGDLDMDRDTLIYGNIIVNGDMEIDNNDTEIIATLYINGDLEISNNLTLGTIDRPTFIFVTGDVFIKNNISGYAYIIADKIEIGNNVDIIGGIYTHDDFEYGNNVYIQENISLDISKLYDYAVPNQIRVPSEDDDSSNDSDYIITYPKLN